VKQIYLRQYSVALSLIAATVCWKYAEKAGLHNGRKSLQRLFSFKISLKISSSSITR